MIASEERMNEGILRIVAIWTELKGFLASRIHVPGICGPIFAENKALVHRGCAFGKVSEPMTVTTYRAVINDMMSSVPRSSCYDLLLKMSPDLNWRSLVAIWIGLLLFEHDIL